MMSKHAERARGKIAHIDQQLEALTRAQKAMPQVGGPGFQDVGRQIAFQRWRRGLLRFCENASVTAIRQRLNTELSALTPEETACIAGDLRGLSDEAYRAVVAAELYMIALGEHPGQQGRGG